MENDAHETRVARIWLGKDGIVRLVYTLDNTELTRPDVEENAVAITKVSAGRKRPQLADIERLKSADRESRIYGSSEAVAEVMTALTCLYNPLEMEGLFDALDAIRHQNLKAILRNG